MTFLTFFVDLIHHIQAHWDMFITSVRDGTIPDIEHIDHIRTYLQVNSRANPQRAEELQSIGPPLTCSTWARRVWPNLKTLVCICSGTFATAMPKVMAVVCHTSDPIQLIRDRRGGLLGKMFSFKTWDMGVRSA
ncbi:hypothetical protein PISMIDRAFT_606870 [Pisolithus microcarpus 441]|uniref:Uncharacterized protein n=1 Tax=Pisolithus microcarpus 441 TaxID=765257 RepID=A0A0C9ZFV1_9AGAM|nr:hypothetical protein PISMIDRAFT_606870 [Pisolithus microcarpus 441]